MTRDEIIRAMQSVCDLDKVDAWQNDFWTITQEELERFAALVAAKERENGGWINPKSLNDLDAVCERIEEVLAEFDTKYEDELATAIRARGD